VNKDEEMYRLIDQIQFRNMKADNATLRALLQEGVKLGQKVLDNGSKYDIEAWIERTKAALKGTDAPST